MIQANVRQMLQRSDAQLVLRLLARGSESAYGDAESVLRDHGLDGLLDDPRLPEALIELRQGMCASYALVSYVLVRHALRTVGEEDRVMADYVASILLHFGLHDRARRVADVDDEVYDTLAELSGAVDGPDPRRAFLVRAHLGNYALWLSGLFPDHVTARRRRRAAPDLEYVEEMGRRGFQLAATHQLAAAHGLAPLYTAASERFPRLRVALNRVSDRYLFPGCHSPDRLMRQVRDGMQWRLAD
jgi:hypothetical protein